MTFLNLPEPLPIFLQVRYLYNLEISTKELVSGKLIALEVYANLPCTGLVLLENGATFHDLPLQAFSYGEAEYHEGGDVYAPSPSEDVRLEKLALPKEVRVFSRSPYKACLGTGNYLYTVTWPKENLLLHLIAWENALLLWPPHKLLFGPNAASELPNYKKLRI